MVMTGFKSCAATTLGFLCTALGVWLRLRAHNLAWPIEWGYSGPRQDTLWAIREHAYQDIALVVLGFGLLLLLLVLASWLWTPPQGRQV